MNPAKIKAKRLDTPKDQVRIAIAGRSSYFHGLAAQLDDQDKPEGSKSYKSAVLIPKSVPKSVIAIWLQGIKDAIEIGITKKWKGHKPADLNLPWRDGNEKALDDPEKYAAYENSFYFTAKKLERLGRPMLKANGEKVTEPGIIESGDWCIFDVNLYPYANKSKGIAVALNGVTLLQEGERFSGGPSEDSIDSVASDLYGEELSTGDADDVLSSLMGGDAEENDPLMDLLG